MEDGNYTGSGAVASAESDVDRPIDEQRDKDPVDRAAKKHDPKDYLGQVFSDSEMVIGLVAAVGTDTKSVIDLLKDRLEVFRYQTREIKVSKDIIPQVADVQVTSSGSDRFKQTNALMDAGDEAR